MIPPDLEGPRRRSWPQQDLVRADRRWLGAGSGFGQRVDRDPGRRPALVGADARVGPAEARRDASVHDRLGHGGAGDAGSSAGDLGVPERQRERRRWLEGAGLRRPGDGACAWRGAAIVLWQHRYGRSRSHQAARQRRQGDQLSWPRRSAHRAAGIDRLLHARGRCDGRRCGSTGIRSTVPDPGHGSLQRDRVGHGNPRPGDRGERRCGSGSIARWTTTRSAWGSGCCADSSASRSVTAKRYGSSVRRRVRRPAAPERCSAGVPTTAPWAVSPGPAMPSVRSTRPRSASKTRPSCEIRTLPGLMSRWRVGRRRRAPAAAMATWSRWPVGRPCGGDVG
jgi:hypothetical protein